MQDRQRQNKGTDLIITSGEENLTPEKVAGSLTNGGLKVDITANNDPDNGGAIVVGTPFAKVTMLPDNVADALGLVGDPTPSDAFAKLAPAAKRSKIYEGELSNADLGAYLRLYEVGMFIFGHLEINTLRAVTGGTLTLPVALPQLETPISAFIPLTTSGSDRVALLQIEGNALSLSSRGSSFPVGAVGITTIMALKAV
jgi:hypothetical protein